jgi:hypothetical protein
MLAGIDWPGRCDCTVIDGPYRLLWQGLLSCEILVVPVAAACTGKFSFYFSKPNQVFATCLSCPSWTFSAVTVREDCKEFKMYKKEKDIRKKKHQILELLNLSGNKLITP